jgi:predicted DNA-binding protein
MNISTMPTSKKRLNLTLPEDLEEMLTALAKRDKVSVASVATKLIQTAIEIEEDAVWARLAAERDTPDAKFISHEEFWK